MKRLILLLAGLLAIFSLSACSSFESEETETSDEAYICIGIDGMDAARTIAPKFNVSELGRFSLYGRKTAEDDWTSFTWYNKTKNSFCSSLDTYQNLLNSTVDIKTGTWYEFKLTAYIYNIGHGNTYFVGTISNKEIVKGKNTLNFTLIPDAERNNNSGYVNVTFKIPSATAVKKAKAGLYKLDSDELYGYSTPQTLSITPSEDSDTATAVYSYGGSISKGSYRLKAWFYADEECTLLLSTFSELVKVLGSSTSEAERNIGKLNTVYTITLNNASYKENFSPKTLYTLYEGVKLPKSEEMQKAGYTFAGWYTNAEGSGEPITEIPSTQAENVVLYAKWTENITWHNVNYQTEHGTTPAAIKVAENSILTSAQLPELSAQDYEFKGWYIGNTKIEAGNYTVRADVTLVAKWNVNSILVVTAENYSSVDIAGKNLGEEYTIRLQGTWDDDSLKKFGSKLKSLSESRSITIDMSNTIGEIDISGKSNSSGYEGIFSECSSIVCVLLPKNLSSIGNFAFIRCKNLKTVSIPATVKTIGKYAFYNCKALDTVKLPNGLTEISESSFMECESLSNVEIPNTVTVIGQYGFACCYSLTSVILPENLTTIEQGAFMKTSLETIKIPEKVSKIGRGAFQDCSSLTKIKIPSGVTELAYEIFSGCQSLKEVELPNSLTLIGLGAFFGCKNLKEIIIPAAVREIYDRAFYGTGLTSAIFIDKSRSWYYATLCFYKNEVYTYSGETGVLGKMSDPAQNAKCLADTHAAHGLYR